jgi:hypothetical protein
VVSEEALGAVFFLLSARERMRESEKGKEF